MSPISDFRLGAYASGSLIASCTKNRSGDITLPEVQLLVYFSPSVGAREYIPIPSEDHQAELKKMIELNLECNDLWQHFLPQVPAEKRHSIVEYAKNERTGRTTCLITLLEVEQP